MDSNETQRTMHALSAGTAGKKTAMLFRRNDTELTTQWSTDYRPTLHVLPAGASRQFFIYIV